MTNIIEQSVWEGSIHLLSRAEKVEGGLTGSANIQAMQLANRTRYLMDSMDVIKSGESPYWSEDAAKAAIQQGIIPEGALFSVRSQNGLAWVDEYRNVNGVPVATGKSLPDASAIIPFVVPNETDPTGTITGLSLTRGGQYFMVRRDDSKFPITYYLNANGVAEVVDRVPGMSTINQLGSDIRKTNVYLPGKNLFNKDAVTAGYYLFEGTGEPKINPDYCYSDYIGVKAGCVYSSDKRIRIVTIYDKDYNYLSDIINVYSFTVPVNAALVRLSVSLPLIDTFQLSFGVGVLPYESYQMVLPQNVQTARMNVIEALDFAPGKNLFDPASVMDGVHLSSEGTILTNSDYTMSVSGYIAVTPGESICINQQWKACTWHDENGVFISRQYDESYVSKPIGAFIIPENAAYLRVEIPKAVVTATMVERGAAATEFEPFHLASPESYTGRPVQYGKKYQNNNPLVFTAGINLFNKRTTRTGYINERGSVYPVQGSAGTDYVYSEYIPVKAGTKYKANLQLRFVEFSDVNKSFISTVVRVTDFTPPAGVEYVRVTVLQANKDLLFLVEGDSLSPPTDYLHVMSSVAADGTPVRIPGGMVRADELDIDFVRHGLLVSGKNIYNKYTRKSGYIDEGGVIREPDARYDYSDFISVTPGKTYALNPGARFVALYAKNKAFIRAVADASQNIKSITPDADCYFVRVTVSVAFSDTFQMEEGTASTAYEPFAYSLLSSMPDGTPVAGGGSQPEPQPETVIVPDVYGMERLRETRMRMTKMTFAQAVRLVVAMLGDSYTRTSARYVLKVAQILWRYFNSAGTAATVPPIGYGWRSFGFDPNGDNTDVIGTKVNRNGFTCAYNTGHGPDISSVTAAASGATISYSQDFSQGFDSFLFAEGGSGVIQCQATGGEPVTIDLSAYPAGMQILPLVLPTTGSGTVTYTVITAPVTLYGVNILNKTASGVLIHKMGGSGSHTRHWVTAMDARWLAAFESLGADLVTIMLGTNDQGAKISATTFRDYILTMIDNVRSVRPTADILLICPAENNRDGGNSIPMTTYAEVMYKIARDDRDVAFLNMQASFGESHEDYAAGSARPWMIGDGLHPDPNTGGYAIAGAITRAIGLPVV
ncbi:SGNH/GDSL hydrolase family protein [Klebsiella pneumoniae]|uniref:SGNH/GDSL hydrolase family protein n=1 Tax=Klebsiella pneumoniae TaxID=573 RepID=UPI0007CBB346|nr:SGNH/GDSL hydrolase family protein [Klebsiella pneumoniae]SAU52486.1 putative prophage endo-N-neuraminidase [Klebsiella pneumoniae]